MFSFYTIKDLLEPIIFCSATATVPGYSWDYSVQQCEEKLFFCLIWTKTGIGNGLSIDTHMENSKKKFEKLFSHLPPATHYGWDEMRWDDYRAKTLRLIVVFAASVWENRNLLILQLRLIIASSLFFFHRMVFIPFMNSPLSYKSCTGCHGDGTWIIMCWIVNTCLRSMHKFRFEIFECRFKHNYVSVCVCLLFKSEIKTKIQISPKLKEEPIIHGRKFMDAQTSTHTESRSITWSFGRSCQSRVGYLISNACKQAD